jgi:hypothetical protein
MMRWLLRTLRPTVACLVLFGLESLYAADLPRTRVEVLRPNTGAMLLTVDAELATVPRPVRVASWNGPHCLRIKGCCSSSR